MHKFWAIAVGCALSVGMGVAQELAGLDESSEDFSFFVAPPGSYAGSLFALGDDLLEWNTALLEWNTAYAGSGDEMFFLDVLDEGKVNLDGTTNDADVVLGVPIDSAAIEELLRTNFEKSEDTLDSLFGSPRAAHILYRAPRDPGVGAARHMGYSPDEGWLELSQFEK